MLVVWTEMNRFISLEYYWKMVVCACFCVFNFKFSIWFSFISNEFIDSSVFMRFFSWLPIVHSIFFNFLFVSNFLTWNGTKKNSNLAHQRQNGKKIKLFLSKATRKSIVFRIETFYFRLNCVFFFAVVTFCFVHRRCNGNRFVVDAMNVVFMSRLLNGHDRWLILTDVRLCAQK